MATRKIKSNQLLASPGHRPFWFDLTETFYGKLQEVAQEFQLTRAEIVSQAVTAALATQGRDSTQKPILPKGKTREELIKDFQRRAAALRWQREPEAVRSKEAKEDFTHLFWVDLPKSFYRQVAQAAQKNNTSEKAFLMKAVNDFIESEREEKRRRILPASEIQEELIREFNRTAGQTRWKGTSLKARKKHAQMMAKKRWGKPDSSQ